MLERYFLRKDTCVIFEIFPSQYSDFLHWDGNICMVHCDWTS